jgi:uncharacterized protein (UPF0332 family)
MSKSSRSAAHARMNQARETLEEAETLFDQDYWRGTINRAYYAMFYAVLALAAFKGIVISKHTHAISFLIRNSSGEVFFRKKSPARFMSGLMNGKTMIMGRSGI